MARRWIRRHRLSEEALFSGTYGLVLASTLAAALDDPNERADPGTDLLWLLFTVVAAAAAHGYARVIARRATAGGAPARGRVRTVLAEWPLVAAALPTVGMQLAAVAHWWPESTAVETALLFNTAALFGWGTWAARITGRTWPASCLAGSLDMVIGLAVIGANAAFK
ncbi:MAG TPA: hypothetical protein VGO89_18395 [Streptomyces sp.]|nr:hypothetical protein [Streptomyces sp.]